MGINRLGELEELMVLAVAGLGKDAYGVPIRNRLVKLAERRVPFGAIYAILNRLERKGFLKSRVGGATKERGGRRKKYYKVTNEGMAALEESRKIRDAMWREIDAVKLEGSPA